MLATTLAVLVVAVAGLRQLQIEGSFTPFMPTDSTELRALERMTAAFGDGEPLLVLVALGAAAPESGTALTSAELARIDDLIARIATVPGVADVVMAPAGAASGTPSGAPASPAPAVAGPPSVATRDGTRHALLRVAPDERADPRALVAGVRAAVADAGASAIVTGEPRLVAEAFDYVCGIVTRLPPLALLLVLVVFRWHIGSTRGTLLSLVPALVAAVLTMGALGWAAGSVSLVTALVPIYVIVLGSADGLHLTSHVLDRRAAGATPVAAVTDTLAALIAPGALSVRSEFSMVDAYKPTTEVRRDLERATAP
ncbi:MAG: hypothetical protein ACNA8N_04935 [Trueperaceae bacterium]